MLIYFLTQGLPVFFSRLAPNSWFSRLSLRMTSVSPHPATCVLNTCIPCVRKVKPTSYLIYFKKSIDNLMDTYTGPWHLWPLLSLSLCLRNPSVGQHFSSYLDVPFCFYPLSLVRTLQGGLMCGLFLGDHLVWRQRMDVFWALGSGGRVGEWKVRCWQLPDHSLGLFTITWTQEWLYQKVIDSFPQPAPPLPTDPQWVVVASTMLHLSPAVKVIFSH